MQGTKSKIRYLMTPGPVEVSPKTLNALSSPVIHHYSPEFIELFEETTEKVKKVFQTKKDLIIMQGEAVLGLEASVANILNPGDKVLVLDNGPYGAWFGIYVENHGGTVVRLKEDYNKAIDPDKVRAALEENKDIKALTVVHMDTPVGITNPINEICKIAKEFGVLTIVDSVAALGGIDIRPDDWDIDICICGSQKCLSCPPALSPISISKEAWKMMEDRKIPLKLSYLSMTDYRDTWIKNRKFPFTPFVSEIYALNASITEILKEGLPNVFARHKKVAEAIRDAVEAIGLKLWPSSREIASNTVTAIKVPQGIDDEKLRRIMAEKYGVLITGDVAGLGGKIFRIGHMGYSAKMDNALVTIAALEKALQEIKFPVKIGSGVEKILKYF
ncbi:alanine--glyoxylate aminotransferase family protein [Candidatus Aerophobetes bacterium]|nr:alanine--glyoxylate aminotransferase family protein [Candidatus Aerophobetes bacterium]